MHVSKATTSQLLYSIRHCVEEHILTSLRSLASIFLKWLMRALMLYVRKNYLSVVGG